MVMLVQTFFPPQPLLFRNPEEIITVRNARDLPAAFAALERALDRGRHIAGYLSYEAGYAFEECFPAPRPSAFPLLCCGIYGPPRRGRSALLAARGTTTVEGFRHSLSFVRYAQRIAAIRRHIARGDVYQITFCHKLKFRCAGNPYALFTRLRREHPVPYAVYIDDGTRHILSLSPERFVRKQGTHILSEPMKGTWPRGSTPREDRANRRFLQHDSKNRAENVMIADLLRNDLGRIGTHVRAPELFTVTGYRSLFQMTSTVTARVPRRLSLRDLCAALFPSGSVTGAPKIRAMQIIRRLEHEPRHIYTGAIGYVTPARDMYWNIPIRTLLLRDGRGEMGVGGGIVWDSTARGEWDESTLKARFLTG